MSIEHERKVGWLKSPTDPYCAYCRSIDSFTSDEGQGDRAGLATYLPRVLE